MSSSPSAASGPGRGRIPKAQKLAVFAIEDQKFYRHWGVDLAAYPSALLPAFMGKRARGASTLTQQLAKNLFLTPERSIVAQDQGNPGGRPDRADLHQGRDPGVLFQPGLPGRRRLRVRGRLPAVFLQPLDSLAINQYALLAGLLQRPEAYRPDVASGGRPGAPQHRARRHERWATSQPMRSSEDGSDG